MRNDRVAIWRDGEPIVAGRRTIIDRFEAMRTFAEVAEHGVNGAARRLRLAPSAVSRRVQGLEAHLGATLVTRTGRRLVLTDEGREYLAGARRVLGDLAEVEGRAAEARTALAGSLRITLPLSYGLSVALPVLLDLRAANPGLALDVDLDDRRVDLAREGFDLAVRVGPLADSGLKARRLATYDMVVAASPAFLSDCPPLTRPSDLEGLPAVVYARAARPEIWTHAAPNAQPSSVRLASALTLGNGEAMRAAAEAGAGLVCVPSFIVADALADGRLVRVLPEADFGRLDAHALWPAERYEPRRLRAVIDALASVRNVPQSG